MDECDESRCRTLQPQGPSKLGHSPKPHTTCHQPFNAYPNRHSRQTCQNPLQGILP
jgi:hypothetical protein